MSTVSWFIGIVGAILGIIAFLNPNLRRGTRVNLFLSVFALICLAVILFPSEDEKPRPSPIQTVSPDGTMPTITQFRNLETLPPETPLPEIEVSLLKMNYLASTVAWVKYDVKDNLGTSYRNILYGRDEGWIIYKLGGEYSTLSGKAFLAFNSRSTTMIGHIEIYGDNALLYISRDFTAAVEPEEFSIDVSGVNQLKFVFIETKRSAYTGVFTGIGDLILR